MCANSDADKISNSDVDKISNINTCLNCGILFINTEMNSRIADTKLVEIPRETMERMTGNKLHKRQCDHLQQEIRNNFDNFKVITKETEQ